MRIFLSVVASLAIGLIIYLSGAFIAGSMNPASADWVPIWKAFLVVVWWVLSIWASIAIWNEYW